MIQSTPLCLLFQVRKFNIALIATLILTVNIAQASPIDTTAYQYTKAGLTYDMFDSQLSDWQMLDLELKFQDNRWAWLPKLAFAQRFEVTGLQFELDAYKSQRNKDYWNFNAGGAIGTIFPQAKACVEFFHPFGKWETSVGARWLQFDQTGSVGVGTVSLSRYYGRFLSSLRFNLAYGFKSDSFLNYALILNHKYYLGDRSYVGLIATYGFDNTLIVISDQSGSNWDNPQQWSLGLNYQTDIQQKRQWYFSYTLTRYDFVTYQRIQHTLTIRFSLHKLQP